MKKKNLAVNLIIFFFIFVFAQQVKAQISPLNKSINIDQIILTPIIVTQAPTITEGPIITEIIDQINNELINQPTNPTESENNNSVKNSLPQIKDGLVYYTQVKNGYKLPVQDGGPKVCTINNAGCGPTTSAMIIASYVDRSITPEKVVDYFRKKGYYLGCKGSSIYHNKIAVESFGVKTSPDIMNLQYKDSKQVAPLLKNYIKAGWTIFTLADFKINGGGHYFWIVDIDDNGNILTYDPWYGRYQQPFNMNVYYPFPKYRNIFKVKKQ